MSKIRNIYAREILDSRGNPTVEAEVTLENGGFGRAAVPSGSSTGIHEAAELRDGDKTRFNGMGVLKAVENVNGEISKKLAGTEWTQKTLDETLIALDGTENKSRLGANAILAISLAFGKAAANEQKKEFFQYLAEISGNTKPLSLPMPMMNFLNGGKHAAGAADIQECMAVPIGAKSFKETLQIGATVFHSLKEILDLKGLPTTVGDEGGFAPKLAVNEEIFSLMVEAIKKAGLEPGKDAALAIDAAASEFYDNKTDRYSFTVENRSFTAEELIAQYGDWITKYPIISIEDGLAEDDWDGWQKMTQIIGLNPQERVGQTNSAVEFVLGSKIQLVGDDLFATNPNRLKIGTEKHVANAILVKPNQIGTVTETIETIMLAKNAGYKTIISHRSGETSDSSIAHFAVGLSMGQIKCGSLSRSERLAKYDELLRIAEKLPPNSFQNNF